MPDTLLLADIGNTCVKIGLASHAGMDVTYALPTRVRYTADSLGLSLLELLRHAERTPDDLTACVMCSVVPDFDVLFRQAWRPLFEARTPSLSLRFFPGYGKPL